MGLFSRAIGWDSQKHSHNAVLANHLVSVANPALKAELAKRLIWLQKQVRAPGSNQSDESILRELSREPRVVQMNFIALACSSLGLPSLLNGIEFAQISNPFRAKSDHNPDRIKVAIQNLSRISGVRLSWPDSPLSIDLVEWLQPKLRDDARPSSSHIGDEDSSNQRIKKSDPEVALDLAYSVLLFNHIETNEELRDLSYNLSSMMHDATNYDIATLVAAYVYNLEHLSETLRPVQMMARLKVLEWLEAGKVSSPNALGFEEVLYERFK